MGTFSLTRAGATMVAITMYTPVQGRPMPSRMLSSIARKHVGSSLPPANIRI